MLLATITFVVALALAPSVRADVIQLPRKAAATSVLSDNDNPFVTVSILQMHFCQAYNFMNFTGLQDMYCGHGVLVPQKPDKFLFNKNHTIAEYYQLLKMQGGLDSMTTKPQIVYKESDTVLYEIGTETMWEKPYFVRWVFCGHMKRWVLDVHVLAVGAGTSPFGTEGAAVAETIQSTKEDDLSDVPTIIAQLEHDFSLAFNEGNFTGVTSFYSKNATVVPFDILQDDSPGLIFKDDIANFFENGHVQMGIDEISCTPDIVTLDPGSDTVAHEIGGAIITIHGRTYPRAPYYTRWVLEDDQWKMDLDLLQIGCTYEQCHHM